MTVDHSFGATLVRGGRHNPASVALACLWGQEYRYEKAKNAIGVRISMDPEGHDIAGHEFISKPSLIVKNGDELTVSGQISHILRGLPLVPGVPTELGGRPDDQIYYKFTKKISTGSLLTQPEKRIAVGGWGFLANIYTPLLNLLGVPVTSSEVSGMIKGLDNMAQTADYTVAADAIILCIAALANEHGH